MPAKRTGTTGSKTRQKAGRVLPSEEGGRGRLGKREVHVPRTKDKQHRGDLPRRHSGP